MECNYCKNILSTKSSLKLHQTTAKFCLKLQGVKNIKELFCCELCGKDFQRKLHLNKHKNICESVKKENKEKENKENNDLKKEIDDLKKEKENKKIDDLKKENNDLNKEINDLKKEIDDLKNRQLVEYRSDYKELATTAVKKHTTSKNIQINNYIEKMEPLTKNDIKSCVNMLTLEHHVKGAEGYAEYALEFPFKNKIVCVDITRNKIQYKNEEGYLIDDTGIKKLITILFESIQDRSYDLSNQHYDKLASKFTDEEMNETDFMATAFAISRYANGHDSDICKKIIKIICQKSTLS